MHTHTRIHETEYHLFYLEVFHLVYLVHLAEGIFSNLKINIFETPYYQKLPNKVIKLEVVEDENIILNKTLIKYEDGKPQYRATDLQWDLFLSNSIVQTFSSW